MGLTHRPDKTCEAEAFRFWTVRDGKIAVWEATFNVWQDGGGPLLPIT